MTTANGVVVLGTRGSVPVSGRNFLHYGHGTTCVLVRLAGQSVVLDAGTGILQLPEWLSEEEGELTVLLTHSHADHVLGLPMCPLVFRKDIRLRIYGQTRMGLTVEQQLLRLMAPPLWPVGPQQLPCQLMFRELSPIVQLGEMTVESMEGVHPGGVSLLKLTGGGKTVVFFTDCNLTGRDRERLLAFAEHCDLLLCDGQYSPEEWPACQHFGHSTWLQAAEFGRECGAGRVRVIHHDPRHTDTILQQAEKELTAQYPMCSFAYAGEEISL